MTNKKNNGTQKEAYYSSENFVGNVMKNANNLTGYFIYIYFVYIYVYAKLLFSFDFEVT